jgi:hypothetical protein
MQRLHFSVMITSAIPVIAVSDSAKAEDYYCDPWLAPEATFCRRFEAGEGF